MALIIRIDADRPYGRRPLLRHVLGTLSSAAYFPRIEALGCLRELGIVLRMLQGLCLGREAWRRKNWEGCRRGVKSRIRGVHRVSATGSAVHLETMLAIPTLPADVGRLLTSFDTKVVK